MMLIERPPCLRLRRFVRRVCTGIEQPPAGTTRERVLPGVAVRVVFRISEAPLRVVDDDGDGRVIGRAVVGGPRAATYVREVSTPNHTVCAELQPGVAAALLGVPAGLLAHRHTALEDLWGRRAEDYRGRLQEAPTAEARLAALEAVLLDHLDERRCVHPAVERALARLAEGAPVGAVVAETGYSHRHLIALFRAAVGLEPKLYARLVRFGGVLGRLAGGHGGSLADVALASGYADQAHLVRDVRELAGLTPGEYRRAAPRLTHHLPIAPGAAGSISSKTPAATTGTVFAPSRRSVPP